MEQNLSKPVPPIFMQHSANKDTHSGTPSTAKISVLDLRLRPDCKLAGKDGQNEGDAKEQTATRLVAHANPHEDPQTKVQRGDASTEKALFLFKLGS